MSLHEVALDVLIEPAPLASVTGNSSDLPILSMTMHEGARRPKGKVQEARGERQHRRLRSLFAEISWLLASRSMKEFCPFRTYMTKRSQLPAYNAWRLRADIEVEPAFLQRFLRSPRASVLPRETARNDRETADSSRRHFSEAHSPSPTPPRAAADYGDPGHGGRAAGQAPGRPRPSRHPNPIHLPRHVRGPRHESEGVARCVAERVQRADPDRSLWIALA